MQLSIVWTYQNRPICACCAGRLARVRLTRIFVPGSPECGTCGGAL